MKKLLALIIALALALTTLALADGGTGSALDAFYALTGQNRPAGKAPADYLADVMANRYAALPADLAEQATLAAELPGLAAITNSDIAAYASANSLSVKKVRNAYYKALANVLRAEIAVNPAAGEAASHARTILELFLEQDAADETERTRIRREMTPDAARTIAADGDLPEGFVTFLIMDENWNDDRWDNDDEWRSAILWDDDVVELKAGSRGEAVADLQEMLIRLGYLNGKADGIFGERTQAALRQYQRANGLADTGVYTDGDALFGSGGDVVARWDYDNSFDDTPAYRDTPDRTPDNTRDNTPDRTPDNTRDNTPDNTP